MLKLIKKSGEKPVCLLQPGVDRQKAQHPVIVRQTVYHAAHLQTQVLAPDYDWSGVRGNSTSSGCSCRAFTILTGWKSLARLFNWTDWCWRISPTLRIDQKRKFWRIPLFCRQVDRLG